MLPLMFASSFMNIPGQQLCWVFAFEYYPLASSDNNVRLVDPLCTQCFHDQVFMCH